MSMSTTSLLTHEYMSILMSTTIQPTTADRLLEVSSAFATKLGVVHVALLDCCKGRLELRLVSARHDEHAEVVRVHVGSESKPKGAQPSDLVSESRGEMSSSGVKARFA